MNPKSLLKKDLYKACKENVALRLRTLQNSLSSIKESRDGDTKSSAGDKYETGRAMMHIEEEKIKRQLAETNRVNQELQKIDLEQTTDNVVVGSLVTTNQGEYFISIGAGKITVDQQLYYCVSIHSPIGAKLLGKAIGDTIDFNGNAISIEAIN